MFRNLVLIFFLTFLASCNCQKSASTDVKSEEEISSDKIKGFLRVKNFEILTDAKTVVAYDIKKTLIEGTTDEYSNKVILRDTLETERAKSLLALLKDDSSYDWTDDENSSDFNPVRQFLVRNDSQRIILLINENAKKMGVINLEGQKVIKLSKEFSNLLDNL